MNVKEYLAKAYGLDETINTKLETLSMLRSLLTKTTSVISGMPQGCGDGRGLEKSIAKIVDLENEVNRDIDELVDLKANIKSMIDTIKNPTQKNMMEMRYLQSKSWIEISDCLGKTLGWVYSLHLETLKDLEKVFGVEQ